MRFQNIPVCVLMLFLVNIGKNEGLLHGNSIHSNNSIHDHLGENVDMTGIMQMLSNLTAELENLKTVEMEHLKQQIEKDQLTIQLLQNRVFSLETEQNNLSKLLSAQEFSTYLSGMNQLTHNLVDNEASDRNLTQQLSKAQGDIKQNNVSTTRLLRNQSMELEMLRRQSGKDRSTIQQLNGSLTQEIRGIKEQIASKSNHHAFTAGISSYNNDWTGDTLVFPVVIYSDRTGYNPSTGIFTAPTAGTYVFYVSVQSYYQKSIWLDIVLNGSSKVTAMAYYMYESDSSIAIYQTGTNLVILHLRTGDRVWVKRYHGSGYYSKSIPVTTFSGFKLY